MFIHVEWENPPRICKPCKAKKAADWYDIDCQRCGTTIRAHRDWDKPPKFCPSCKAAMDAEWYDVTCQRCSTTIRARHDWDKPPKYCKPCKAITDAEWYELNCERCGGNIRARHDWAKPPRFCKSCKAANDAKWGESSCTLCSGSMRVKKDWENPPQFCKSCRDKYPDKEVPCRLCGQPILIKSGMQLNCAKNGWELPSQCEECKHDFLMIKGAVGALRSQYRFPLETTIERRGWLRTDKVAVVRNKKTQDVVAEVRMDEKGIFFTERVATTYVQDLSRPKPLFRSHPFDVATHETRDDEKGFIFKERVANTYVEDPDAPKPWFGEKKKTLHTHETQNTHEGMLFPKRVTETRSATNPDAPVVKTRVAEKGFFSRIKFWSSDKEKR